MLIFKDCTYSRENMDWYWTRSSIRSSLPSSKKNKHSSSARRFTSRRRWCDWILEIKGWSSERIWELTILVWWNVEEQDARRRRQQEKISIFYWLVRTRNSLSPSSSRSFRTQSHWSYTSGQCVISEQFLRVHLSYWMCNQFTLHHSLASYKHKNWQRHQDTVCLVDVQLAQRRGLMFCQTRCNAIILYDTLTAYCISKVVVMESGEIIYEKVFVSLRPPPMISFKDNWMKELDSEVAGSSKDTQRIQPKPETQLSRTVRTVGGSKSIQSCVSMPVKIEDEDQTGTGRPAGGQEPTKVEELDIDFRVPGLSHAVVKQAENFRGSRTREEDRESSSSRSTSSRLAAD